jgi:hypothetical protein
VIRRARTLLIAFALIATACGIETGVRLPACETATRDRSAATILSVQAVPTALYTPCINALPLGWDNVEFDAEDGLARIQIGRFEHVFLTASVTATCDTAGAVEVAGPADDIRRFHRIQAVEPDVMVTIVPTARRPLEWADTVVADLEGVEIEDRPLHVVLDGRLSESVTVRVDEAQARGHYVWIVDELDAEEGTLEMRSAKPEAVAAGISVVDALDLIDDTLDDVRYEGEWYFTFTGGCITYEFDAKHRLAETIASDAERAIGFYPAEELRDIARDAGYELR